MPHTLAGALKDIPPVPSFQVSAATASEFYEQDICLDPFVDSQLAGLAITHDITHGGGSA